MLSLQTGFAAALPYLTMAFMVYIGGQIADVIRTRGILSTTFTRKVFTGGGEYKAKPTISSEITEAGSRAQNG